MITPEAVDRRVVEIEDEGTDEAWEHEGGASANVSTSAAARIRCDISCHMLPPGPESKSEPMFETKLGSNLSRATEPKVGLSSPMPTAVYASWSERAASGCRYGFRGDDDAMTAGDTILYIAAYSFFYFQDSI